MKPAWPIVIGAGTTGDFEAIYRREWLETNGLGGWAGSTVSGAHSRRYHGLLVAALDPPVGRMVLLSRLEETIEIDGARHELACNRYPGVVHPRGYEYLERFERGLFPVFTYNMDGILLRRTVAAIHGHNTVVIRYDLEAAAGEAEPGAFVLGLRPFVAGRDYHHLTRANGDIRQEAELHKGVLCLPSYPGVPDVQLHLPAAAAFTAAPEWYYDFEYDREEYRGLDNREDLFTHGLVELALRVGDQVTIVATIETGEMDGAALLVAEEARRQVLLADIPNGSPHRNLRRHLHLAADQFLVRRDVDLRTIIAGYHWFTDWGRDTMIALPGIALVTGRHDEARRILQAFAGAVQDGLLPNRFADGGGADYNTVDATLWFFVAVHHYLAATGDEQLVTELMPVLDDILAWHEKGTRYGIRVDDDGLLMAGEDGQQLTWMDAKVDGWVVTPRRGKPVEIQALWYNALRIYAGLAQFLAAPAAQSDAEARAAQVHSRFGEVFWNAAQGCLFDVVDVDGVSGRCDPAVRPNQLFALSLPYALIEGEQARSILKVSRQQLATPRGLRSLSPEDPSYCGHYGGSPLARDGAYHQGTVWGWLIGPYLTAWLRHGGAQGQTLARKAIEDFAEHLQDGCIGTIAEVFDGDAPHEPRGTVAQAWSVAELLRVLHELDTEQIQR
ncbi:MAG: glycogen debranching enzyme N-terminal domain-containing protein [bacterium]|nr:glycogen debranching enzyme N-terminal domain-containing protein [bacterium]